MAINVLNPELRGLIKNSVFEGRTIFSNGTPSTQRPDSFGAIYVLNDDILFPESFLGMHPHSNVEIVTVMISGEESHNDTLGIHENYNIGDTQLISSGKGVCHEGGNISTSEYARHLQIWIAPRELNLEPRVQVKKYEPFQNGPLSLIVSPTGIDNSLQINQNVWLFRSKIDKDETLDYQLQSEENGIMIYLIDGILEINSIVIPAGGTAFITGEDHLNIISIDQNTDFVLIETVF